MRICGEIRAPRSLIDPGAFFIVFRVGFFFLEGMIMDKKELAYAKQTVVTVKDWDAYQAVIRSITKIQRYFVSQDRRQ